MTKQDVDALFVATYGPVTWFNAWRKKTFALGVQAGMIQAEAVLSKACERTTPKQHDTVMLGLVRGRRLIRENRRIGP